MQTQNTFNDSFDAAELTQLVRAVPAETEQLMRGSPPVCPFADLADDIRHAA